MPTAASSSESGEIPARQRNPLHYLFGLDESPHPKAEKSSTPWNPTVRPVPCLNESPRPKAGKSGKLVSHTVAKQASMKVPARRRRNRLPAPCPAQCSRGLNESPSNEEGKLRLRPSPKNSSQGLNESPPKRKGNTGPTPARVGFSLCLNESLHLKVQNKRSHSHLGGILICLIESPYKQEGKFSRHSAKSVQFTPQ